MDEWVIEAVNEYCISKGLFDVKEDLIRCKDCINCLDTDKYCVCMYWCCDTELDGFCHKGKRKEE